MATAEHQERLEYLGQSVQQEPQGLQEPLVSRVPMVLRVQAEPQDQQVLQDQLVHQASQDQVE